MIEDNFFFISLLPFMKAENLKFRRKNTNYTQLKVFSMAFSLLHFGKFVLSIKYKLRTTIRQNVMKHNEGTMYFFAVSVLKFSSASGKNRLFKYKPGATGCSGTCWTSAGKSY